MKNDVKKILTEHESLTGIITNDDFLIGQIVEIIDLIYDCFKHDKKVLICGNGGVLLMPSIWRQSL